MLIIDYLLSSGRMMYINTFSKVYIDQNIGRGKTKNLEIIFNYF